jgi:hypothetical protein
VCLIWTFVVVVVNVGVGQCLGLSLPNGVF